MKNIIQLLTVAIVCVSMFGCSMCCGPYDYDYPTFGGKHQRSNPTYGRVGSPYSDPSSAWAGPSADSNLDAADKGRFRKRPDDIDDFEDDEEAKKKRLESLMNEDGLNTDGGIDEIPSDGSGTRENLPSPDDTPEVDESTASRLWRERPLRNQRSWR